MIASRWATVPIALVTIVTGCSGHEGRSGGSTAAASGSVSGSLSASNQAQTQDPGNWSMAPGDYANTRFSKLNEITATNVNRMKVAWTFSTGMVAGHEAAP